jgi:ATP-dependent protease ClpP protease subunit
MSIKTIHLTANNSIALKGKITDESVGYIVKHLIKNNPEYLFVDSMGGSVFAGAYLVETLRNLKVKCIIGKAYSMAFVILQACESRYVLPTSTAMQHQVSLRTNGELKQTKEYIAMVSAMEEHLNNMQSSRIGMDIDEFTNKVSTEWWLFGENIVANGVADAVVFITCSKDLVKKQITIKETQFIFETSRTYNACPLIPDTI